MSESIVPEVHMVKVRDGQEIGVAVYRPKGEGPYPCLFAASPYRFDNNSLPSSPQFLWRETGPIDFYVNEQYVYVHMDVRGSGRSGGHFDFLGPHDANDMKDVIDWVAEQPWSTGRVGSIGQSYYCMLQWFLGKAAPKALKCIGAHDGLADAYRAGVYHGGIPCDFFPGYWWYQNRFINRFPASGPSREQNDDLTQMLAAHPTYDDFWRERSAWECLDQITVPLYSSGVWSKMMLHTRGNIDGYLKARGPKKLRMSGAPNAWAAAAEFASEQFHKEIGIAGRGRREKCQFDGTRNFQILCENFRREGQHSSGRIKPTLWSCGPKAHHTSHPAWLRIGITGCILRLDSREGESTIVQRGDTSLSF